MAASAFDICDGGRVQQPRVERERATAQQDPHPLLRSPGRSRADGPPEEGREKLSQKWSKFPLVWGAVVCVSLCMLSVIHSLWP